ncbi:MAG: hypothetical protein HY889_07295 [Deltaproteobacteria bacterium]|nr:hypothetical protein [Deltaproteobacteria bacterium]
MYLKKTTVFLSLLLLFCLRATAYAGESEITKKFAAALDSQDLQIMTAVIKENGDKVPGEIRALVDDALLKGTPAEERDSKLYLAERMATVYKDVSGDAEPLKTVKKKNFEAKLTEPARPAPINGVYTVETLYTDAAKNFFKPDNIVIKSGETVRWVDRDNAAHILASMPFIGEGGIFSAKVEPGGNWEHKFDKPGEYYYICFIHKVMYGKITVEK